MIHMAKTSHSVFNKIKISNGTCPLFPLGPSIYSWCPILLKLHHAKLCRNYPEIQMKGVSGKGVTHILRFAILLGMPRIVLQNSTMGL